MVAHTIREKLNAPVKQHDAEINTCYVLYGCIFSKKQLSTTKSSTVEKAIPSSSVIKKRSLSCTCRRDTFIRLVYDRRAQETFLIVLSRAKTLTLHNLLVKSYILPVLEDYSLGTDGERMLPRLLKIYKYCDYS
ncbi:hypothetical protein C5167_034738 [Papaver somniferum]|uniref:Uncharacterized protein n=1 Tax=Papaver somniferum TaxID=3469 RepID=A0A4Y7KDT8_PAPSO|nr:hypothetical protein C5167_034738 [Papaver somniferum]